MIWRMAAWAPSWSPWFTAVSIRDVAELPGARIAPPVVLGPTRGLGILGGKGALSSVGLGAEGAACGVVPGNSWVGV